MNQRKDMRVVLFLHSINLFKLLRPVDEVNRIPLVIQETLREGVYSRQRVRPLHDPEPFSTICSSTSSAFSFSILCLKSLYSANFDAAPGEVQDNELDGVEVEAGHQAEVGGEVDVHA